MKTKEGILEYPDEILISLKEDEELAKDVKNA